MPNKLLSLREPREIQEVLKKGRKFTSTHFVFFYLPTAAPFKLAVAIKRNWDKAVRRNQTRRRIREWVRVQKNLSGKMLITQKAFFQNREERSLICEEVQKIFEKIKSHA